MAEPNAGFNLTNQSVTNMGSTDNPRAESAVGWEDEITMASMISFSDLFWDRFAGAAQDNVDDATYNACWDTWVAVPFSQTILTYAVKGDYSVTLAPTRWSD